MGVERSICLTRDGGTLGVTDSDHLGTLLACVTHSHQGIHGLTGLRQSNDERLLVHNRIAVAELVRELDLGWDTAPVLDGVACNVASVSRSTAGDDDDLVDGLQN